MTAMDKYYSAYYMMTALCNLSCSYCVLENSPNQLSQELPYKGKEELIRHLYDKFRVRSLTISGGEPVCIGKNSGKDFIALMGFLRQFKSSRKETNLVVKLYSNGLLMTKDVVKSMQCVVDCVSVNIDSCNESILYTIGRSNKYNGSYLPKVLDSLRLLYKYNVKVKLHSVISKLNCDSIVEEAPLIYQAVRNANPLIEKWKFYQYMSYDNPDKDSAHAISSESFDAISRRVAAALMKYDVKVRFKSVDEMNDSLFNILATGVAQYRKDGDTWTTTRRTKNLLNYSSIGEMLTENDIDARLFDKYHLCNLFE